MNQYWRNVASMATRFGNSLFGGDKRGESISSAVGRKAIAGRRRYIFWEACINLLFALPPMSQRNHCEEQAKKEQHG